MHVHLLSVAFDSGHAATRLGRGPGAFLAAGLVERLRGAGHSVEPIAVETGARFPTEIATAFELDRRLAGAVRAAVWQRALPLVLTGNCISALGVLAGLGAKEPELLWLDAHADYHTPETTTSGFLDGMALATATGRCWRALAATLPGFRPVPSGRVTLLGARAFDAGERERFLVDGGRLVGVEELRAQGPAAALAPLGGADGVYLHLDLDVLDPGAGRANAFAAPGGLRAGELLALLAELRARAPLAALTLSAYDPAQDPEGRVLEIGLRCVDALLG